MTYEVHALDPAQLPERVDDYSMFMKPTGKIIAAQTTAEAIEAVLNEREKACLTDVIDDTPDCSIWFVLSMEPAFLLIPTSDIFEAR